MVIKSVDGSRNDSLLRTYFNERTHTLNDVSFSEVHR